MLRTLAVILFALSFACTVEEEPSNNPYQPAGGGGGDSDPTCTPECGPRECGQDPVCGLSCGVCDLEATCDNGVCVFPDGPIIVNTVTSSSTLSPYNSVDLEVIASDPDGVEDVLGGVLYDDTTGATYGSFVATGTPGTYSYTLTWGGVDAVRTIDAPPEGVSRAFRIEFFDAANHRIAQTTNLTLSCDVTGYTACSGFCTDLMVDPDNCGACGVPVPATPPDLTCEGGTPTCPGGAKACGGECVDTDTSLEHCGDCNVAVPTGGTCEEGVPTCAGGGAACGGECVDTDTSLEHCGGCNVAVPTGGTCEEGVPTCPDPTTNCSGACVNTQTDTANCGDCNVAVPQGGVCNEGVPGCPTGQENCSGVCQTSCEVDCTSDCTNAIYSACSCDISDPCGWSNDGYCDVDRQAGDCGSYLPTFDDSGDCGGGGDCGTECTEGVYSSCTCGADDPCGWSNDGYCDIGQQTGDCGSYEPTFDDSSDC